MIASPDYFRGDELRGTSRPTGGLLSWASSNDSHRGSRRSPHRGSISRSRPRVVPPETYRDKFSPDPILSGQCELQLWAFHHRLETANRILPPLEDTARWTSGYGFSAFPAFGDDSRDAKTTGGGDDAEANLMFRLDI
ncbi:hypothetical protein M885DRAFT_561537 [Pelagophyceae sp. CCMP2097]|nr:hypothetical protein M885DRAFT_561537 [Pelagophyceae sp. CCMP2097]|mmetsp:Transcript_24435/g.87341  ORF Transcript_24435/g.87341 Transcript_24435/m.87341 type:complete len:138 (+) Transcript_24435:159-572(+)